MIKKKEQAAKLCKLCRVTEKLDQIDSDESLPADYEPPKMELVYKGAQSHVVISKNNNDINQIDYTVKNPSTNMQQGSTSVGETDKLIASKTVED